MAAEDPSPIVRLSLASAAGRLPPQHRWHLLANLMEHASDADDPNLPLMYWYALEPLADVDADRALALAMRAGVAIPLLRNFMLRRVAAGGSEEALRRLVEALGRADAVDAQVMFLQALRAALVGRRQATAPPQWPPLATRLMQSAAPEVRVRTAVLGNLFGDPHATAYLLNVLQDSQAETTWRQEALAALLSSRAASLPDLLEQLLRDAATPTSLLPDLIHGLVAVDAPRAEQLLLELYDHLPPEGRRNVLAAMTKRPDLALRLVEAIESGTIPARDLTADLARRIQYLGDERLVARLENVWGSLQPTSAEKGRLIAQYKELVERTDLPDADVRLGRKLYGETCGRCHRLFGEGNTIGPDLTGSNRANVDYLLENIVDPSAVMAKEYRPEVVLTEDGQVLTGLVVEDTDRALILRSAEETTVVAKDEIVQRMTSSTSMMPDNQLQQFTEHEIRSLLAYLRSPSPVPLPDTDSPPSSVPQE
ncbi:MAG: hypothetical protein KatS3mg111_3094 [Pirellulaceae bacterium]|nr:MAG: hypothetical protein KatS3mg111_3094 [Pirellulaceae bacterium]